MADEVLSDDDVGITPASKSGPPVLSDADVGVTPQSSWLDRQAPIQGAKQEAVKGVGALAKGAEIAAYFTPPDTVDPGGGGYFPTRKSVEDYEKFAEKLQRPSSEQIKDIMSGPAYEWGKAIQNAAEDVYPLTDEEKKGIFTKVGQMAGGFVPMMATGPAAPATIGLQAMGDGLENEYNKQLASGKSSDDAADAAINRALASGAVQSTIFALLPVPLRKAGDKLLIDKFSKGMLSRFLTGRIAQAGEGAVLGATSKAAQNVIEGESPIKDVFSSGAGMAAAQAFFPRGPTKTEEDFNAPPSKPLPSPENYFGSDIPEKQNIIQPSEYVPPEPGPIGEIPPGGTEPVPRRRIRINLQPSTTGVQNAPQERQIPPDNVGEYQGVPQGTDVRQNEDEIREANGGQAGGSGGVQPSSKVEEQTPNQGALKQINTDWDVRVQAPQTMPDGKTVVPGYVQIGDAAGNRWSSNPDAMRAEGYDVPPMKDWASLPSGNYKLGEAIQKLTGKAPETDTTASQLKFPPVEVPSKQIVARPELMQFKAIGDEKTGENQSEKLAGKWDESKAGLLMLWEPQDPSKYGLSGDEKYIVANGHHRFAFGEREKVPAYASQIFRESDGYSAEDVRRIAAEANIADGKGTIYDQVKYLRNSPSARSADARLEATKRIGNRGKQATDIAFNAGDDLYAAFVNERIDPDQTQAIATAAPANVAAQRFGIKFALDGKSHTELDALVRRAMSETGKSGADLDFFGQDDSLIKRMEDEEAKAEEIRQGIRDQIRSVQGAAKNPKLAKKLGVDVKDPAGVNKRVEQLKTLLDRWQNWFLSGNEDLQKQVRGNLPQWAREEMQSRGLDTNRPLNEQDLQNPSVVAAVKNDPTLTPQEKQNVLETGSPKTPPSQEERVAATAAESGQTDKQYVERQLKENPEKVEDWRRTAKGVGVSLDQWVEMTRYNDYQQQEKYGTTRAKLMEQWSLREPPKGEIKVTRAKDFETSGEYVVTDGKNTARIYRDSETKWWYDAADGNRPTTSPLSTENRAEAIERLKEKWQEKEPEPLALNPPESVEEQSARQREKEQKKRSKAAEEAKRTELAEKAKSRLVGDVGTAGQGGLFAEPGQQELLQPKPAEREPEDAIGQLESETSETLDREEKQDRQTIADLARQGYSKKSIQDSSAGKRIGEKEVNKIIESTKSSTLSESQRETISAVQKYRLGSSPQTYSLVERLPQSASEKELGEQPVKVKNDKTGEVQTVLETDLTPVKTRSAEERAASKSMTVGQLDDAIRKEGLDPKDFPDKSAKREVLRRLGKLTRREAAEDVAEKLETKKLKGKPGELFITLFPGLDPGTIRTVWNGAITVAQAAIRAGGSIADAIDQGIRYLRDSVQTQWDEAAVRRELEASLGPQESSDRHQVAGVRNIGSEYKPENIRAIQTRLRVGYFDGTQPVELARTDEAWDIANRLIDPQNRAQFSSEVTQNGGGNMAPGLLVKELFDYAVKMAMNRDDSLLRFIVNRYADFQTIAEGGSTSKAGQVLRSARELSDNPLWSALVNMERDAAASAGRRLAVGEELFNDIVSRINDLSLTPEEVESVMNEGRDAEGRSLREILDSISPDRAEAANVLEDYDPQLRRTALETVYEFLKQNTITDERTFVDTLTRRLLELGNVDIDEATARQIAEGTWTRKNTVETERRRANWDRVLKELDERAERTAQGYVNRLEASQTEWSVNPERRNETLKVIREALDPKTPLPQNPGLFRVPLRDRLIALGVARDTATRLANEIYERRLADFASARTRAMERASQSQSVTSLVEAIKSAPYRAQKDPAWRQRVAEDWFMSNGLSRDQAQTAARIFSDQFEKALQTAGEKVATQLLDGKPPRTIADVIRAIRAGLTDPAKNWVEEIASLNGWKSLTPEQHAKLAEIDQKLSDPSLSLPEQSDLFDQMNSIVQRAGDGSKRWKYAIGELFASAKLSGVKTFTLHLFQPVIQTFVRDFPVATAFQTRDIGTIAKAYVEAAKNFFPEMRYAWQKDVYYLSQSKMISYHNELRNQFEDGLKSLKSGDIKGALKLSYAWSQYFLRALQAANQANQAVIREWKLTLYGSQAMRDAGMSTGEISRLVDSISEMKQAAYEEGLSKGMSKSAAYVRADDLTFQQMRQYFANKIPGDTRSIADEIVRSAENDQYSSVGRLTAENTGKEEGWYLSYLPNKLLNVASDMRREGGFRSVLGMTIFGFVNIPLRSARYLSNFSPYGFIRYARNRLGQARGWENPWRQMMATDLQAKQRLREAVVGTALGTLALGLFHPTTDDDREKRKLAVYVSGAWKGIKSQTTRDALDKIGLKPLSISVVVDGKVRASIPITRTGHIAGFMLGMSSMADDMAWRNKEAAVMGKEVPVSADVASALGTMYYIVGQQGLLQSISHFQTVAQGSVGGSAIEKSIADAASSLVGGFIPGQVFLQNMSEMINGPLDKSSVESDIAANFPIVGAHWQQHAMNRFGDPLYDQTWYGKSLRLGAPIAFKIQQNPDNQALYGMIVDKGVSPPDLRRYSIEQKYGPLSDDQWSQFVRASGQTLKDAVVGNLDTLQGEEPADVKKFFNKQSTLANDTAAESLALEPVKPSARSSSSGSGGVSAPSIPSGRAVGPSALRGLPKSSGSRRIRRISSGAPRSIRVRKLSASHRGVSGGRKRSSRLLASTSTTRKRRKIAIA